MQPFLNKTYKEKPILFSEPMIRALLDGSKTQTRNVVKPMRSQDWLSDELLSRSPRAKPVTINGEQWAQFAHPLAGQNVRGIQHDEWSPLTCIKHPYGQPGDRLWAREAWVPDAPMDGTWPDVSFYGCKDAPLSMIPIEYRKPVHCLFRATWNGSPLGRWNHATKMPRWASRITLEITAVRVERLQDISYEDALAEGVPDARPLLGNTEPNYGETADETSRRLRWPQREYELLWNTINGVGAWDKNPWVWCVSFKRIPQ